MADSMYLWLCSSAAATVTTASAAAAGSAMPAVIVASKGGHPLLSVINTTRVQVAGQSWFGGGADITPSYLFEDDAREFHTYWRNVCDAHSPGLYAEHKAWCDR